MGFKNEMKSYENVTKKCEMRMKKRNHKWTSDKQLFGLLRIIKKRVVSCWQSALHNNDFLSYYINGCILLCVSIK
jgi:hypothetical protein